MTLKCGRCSSKYDSCNVFQWEIGRSFHLLPHCCTQVLRCIVQKLWAILWELENDFSVLSIREIVLCCQEANLECFNAGVVAVIFCVDVAIKFNNSSLLDVSDNVWWYYILKNISCIIYAWGLALSTLLFHCLCVRIKVHIIYSRL